MFTDLYKGGIRLNVLAHGDWLPICGKTSRLVGEKGELLKVGNVYNILNQSYSDLKQFNSIRIISCSSANGGSSSFGQRLSNLTGLPVKAYKGSVFSYNTPKYGKLFSIAKKDHHFEPRNFNPLPKKI